MRIINKYRIICALIVFLVTSSFIVFKNKSTENTNRVGDIEDNNSTLESFYNDKSEYDISFEKSINRRKEDVIAGIVSHHFLAKDLIANFFSGINTKDVKNIYIIGPDHYEAVSNDTSDLFTSNLNWKTPYGELKANRDLINYLLSETNNKNINVNINGNTNIEVNDTIFKNEHSIYTLVPFAKKVFPDAKITPLILKSSTDYQKFYNLGKQMYNKDSILIVSSDFSHKVNANQAYENDIKSIKTLVSPNLSTLDLIQSDCKQCIAFMYGYISQVSNRFVLIENKTSEDFGSNDKQDLTSYISAYYVPNDTRLSFGGDMMLDRYIRQIGNNNGYDFIFQKLHGYLIDKDLVIVNLEGPITPYKSLSIGSEIGSRNNYIFTFYKSTSDIISNKNIKLVNIGNNHILNFGNEGLDYTKEFLSNSKVDFFGNTGSEDTTFSIEIKGNKLAFINYNQFVENNLEETIKKIEQLKKINDFVFVYTHWGNEYSKDITNLQRELAHKFIDAGADTIIGSHPHVVQETEIYKDKRIYYSLGNLIFDQYFSKDTKEGLLVEIIIKDNKEINYIEHIVNMKENGQTVF